MKNFNKCVFLDRDGVLNKDLGYISNIKKFKIYPFTGKAIKLLNDHGYLVILITNQAGVGRGLITLKELNSIHVYLKKIIKKIKLLLMIYIFVLFILRMEWVNIKRKLKTANLDRVWLKKQLRDGKLTLKLVL